MPTTFDCSLGSAIGFGAGCLIEQRFNGHVVSIRNTTLPAENWRIGGVPILALLESAPKLGFGYRKLVVPSHEVDLNGPIYQKFKQLQRYWEVTDHYCNPGPTQFYDPDHKNDLTSSIKLQFQNRAHEM